MIVLPPTAALLVRPAPAPALEVLPPGAPHRPTPVAVVGPVALAGAGPLASVRQEALIRAGWRPVLVPLATTVAGDLRAAAAEAERVVTAVAAAGATAVDVWATDGELALEVVERLWHRGMRTTVLLVEGVLSAEGLAALAEAVPGGRAAAALREACAQADAVVLATSRPAPLLAAYAGPFRRVALADPAAPAAAPALPRPVPGCRLSVLVTTYERPEALRACLHALAVQTLPRTAFEVVVVDDGSSTPVGPVVEAFTDVLDVRLVELGTNRGLGAARDAGLAHVRAGTTLLMDDDDLPEPGCLAEHVRAHAEHPGEHVAVLGATAVIPDGRVTALSRHVTTVGRQYFAYPGIRDGEVHPWRAFWGGRSSAKTSLLRRHGFRAPFMEDADFAFRAAVDGLQVVHARGALQVVRDRLSLEHFRRRQNRIGHAMLDLALRCDDDAVWTWAGMQPVAANLRRWVPQRAAVASVLHQLLDLPLHELRAGRAGDLTLLQLLDQALFIDLDAHYAAGQLAGLARRAARTQERRLRIAADATDPGAVDLVRALAGREDLEAVLVAADEATAGLMAERVAAALIDGPVVHVDVRAGGPPAADLRDADLLLPGSMGAEWRPGAPVPLIGQPLTAWLQQLGTGDGPVGALR